MRKIRTAIADRDGPPALFPATTRADVELGLGDLLAGVYGRDAIDAIGKRNNADSTKELAIDALLARPWVRSERLFSVDPSGRVPHRWRDLLSFGLGVPEDAH